MYPLPFIALPPGREVLSTLAVVLRALLAAVFGAAAMKPRDHRALDGCIRPIEAMPETVPYEEWIAVPAPWRAGFWWVKPRRGAHMAASPYRCGPRAARVRAPPAGGIPFVA
ncbi:MAG: hypothetical protein NT133_13080 [Alphaproteobacteria bacterium]|nr:hypothetical protein [Alphaproteobacteria bacterium]